MKINTQNLLLLVILLTINTPFFSQETIIKDSLLNKAHSFKFKNQDSSFYYFNKGYELSLQKKDTLKAIRFLTDLSELHSHTLNYEKAYDGYWKALLLADKSNDSISKANAYLGLGWLYSFYKRNDEAEKYFIEALNVRKDLVNKNKLNIGNLIQTYFSLASLYRVNNKYDRAKTYLDSIHVLKKRIELFEEDSYVNAELGYLAAKNGDIDLGLKHLYKTANYFETTAPSYLVVIYALLGDVHKDIGNLKESENYFLKSLDISEKYSSHLDYKIFVYEELSQLYLQKNNLKKAITFQKKAKVLNEEIYSIKNNLHLFEIKDKYRIEQKRQQDIAKQQRIKQLEQEDRIWTLQTIILIVSLVFIIIFSYLTIRNIRNKHKNEKLVIQERQKERIKRHREVLELKNKELTESALRLIEKDEFIASIKLRLSNQKDNLDVNVIKRILKSIQGTPQSNWSEFEARFTTIHQSFYKQLKSKFPNLKQTDLKICALVKLNFPSKDMAKLLGISVESVHTSRHRLRKKLGLTRNDNLEEFINKF